jgi:beta-galactosidase
MKLVLWQTAFVYFALLSALVLTCTTSEAAEANAPAVGRQRLSLDGGWRFHQGDIPFPVVTGHGASYNNAKAGTAQGAAAMDFDDSVWRAVDLPHDWAVETPIDPNANLSQGFHPRGFGWYRRSFKLDRADKGKHIALQFDAVSTFCTVWFTETGAGIRGSRSTSHPSPDSATTRTTSPSASTRNPRRGGGTRAPAFIATPGS